MDFLSFLDKTKAFLRLIRWPNLVMMALSLVLIRWVLFYPLQIPVVLSDFHYLLLIFSTVCMGAMGYIVNDLFDLENDRVNKPERITIGKSISTRFAWNATYFFFLVGAALGWYLGQISGRWMYGLINSITGFWLYLYASDFKGRPLLGNILISFLSAGVLTYPIFFDVLPRWPLDPEDVGRQIALILCIYFAFAFLISLMRELVKDLQDTEGDKKVRLRTVPLAWGNQVARALVFFIGGLVSVGLMYLLVGMAEGDPYSVFYLAVFVLLPLLASLLISIRAKKPSDYKNASRLLKICMLDAILSIAFITISFLWL